MRELVEEIVNEAASAELDKFEPAEMMCGDYTASQMIDMFSAGAAYRDRRLNWPRDIIEKLYNEWDTIEDEIKRDMVKRIKDLI